MNEFPPLTLLEAARYLGMEPNRLYSLAQRGGMAAVRQKGSWFFQREELDHWLEKAAAKLSLDEPLPPEPQWVELEEAAELLGDSRLDLLKMLAEGRLEGERDSDGGWRISELAVESLLEQRKKAGHESREGGLVSAAKLPPPGSIRRPPPEDSQPEVPAGARITGPEGLENGSRRLPKASGRIGLWIKRSPTTAAFLSSPRVKEIKELYDGLVTDFYDYYSYGVPSGETLYQAVYQRVFGDRTVQAKLDDGRFGTILIQASRAYDAGAHKEFFLFLHGIVLFLLGAGEADDSLRVPLMREYQRFFRTFTGVHEHRKQVFATLKYFQEFEEELGLEASLLESATFEVFPGYREFFAQAEAEEL